MAGIAVPTSPSHPDGVTKTVIGHATNALLGATTVVKACTRTSDGTLTIRLRTVATAPDSSTQEPRTIRTQRALVLVERELHKHMPLVHCTLQNSDIDGVDEVEVSVPGPREAWCRARVVCEATVASSLLRAVAALLATGAVALIAYPFVRDFAGPVV